MGIFEDKKEISSLKKSGQISAQAMDKVLAAVAKGVKKSDLDKIAKEEIEKLGGKPSFMTVPGYFWTTCVTINEEVVHGVPDDSLIKEEDLISIDLGTVYQGLHTDMARSVLVGEDNKRLSDFIEVGRYALDEAIKKARVGKRIGDISAVIQKIVEKEGYKIVRSLTGHGIGRNLHEDPYVPGFGRNNSGPQILEGMALAIEVIYAMGSGDITYKGKDGWTLKTVDNSLAALFEDTVLVTKSGPLILTRA